MMMMMEVENVHVNGPEMNYEILSCEVIGWWRCRFGDILRHISSVSIVSDGRSVSIATGLRSLRPNRSQVRGFPGKK